MSEITPNNPEEEKPINQLDVILLQISWLERELAYAEAKMQEKIDIEEEKRHGFNSTTDQTRAERFSEGAGTTTLDVMMGYISRFEMQLII